MGRLREKWMGCVCGGWASIRSTRSWRAESPRPNWSITAWKRTLQSSRCQNYKPTPSSIFPGETMRFVFVTLFAACAFGQTYDLLLQGGHVVDAKNNISAVRDVGIKDGKIAAVAARIDPSSALKVVNVGGLY